MNNVKKMKMIRLYPDDLKNLKVLKTKIGCKTDNEVIEKGLELLTLLYNNNNNTDKKEVV